MVHCVLEEILLVYLAKLSKKYQKCQTSKIKFLLPDSCQKCQI